MKLILKQEVTGLGGPGDVVEVKDGFGRNYLVPRGDAIRWTKGAEKEIAALKRAREVREVADLGHANDIKDQLESLSVTLAARAGEGGRLFGSVSPSDLADAMKAAGGPAVDKRRIEVGNPIKTVGVHQVNVRVHPEVVAVVSVDVVAA